MHVLTCDEPMAFEQVGGKFARQQEMYLKGVPIAPFICLTSQAYELVFTAVRQDVAQIINRIDFNDYSTVIDASRRIRKCYENLTFPPNLKMALKGAFERQFVKREGLYAVRASMVGANLLESEDSAANPFAGMSESFLFVHPTQLEEKIHLCWASGFSAESILYRYKNNFELTAFSVAVGIQQMISGKRSFVLFTSNPKTAVKESLVVAGLGLGEGVVQESVPTDHFVLKDGLVLNSYIRRKEFRLVLDMEKGHGLKREGVSKEEAALPCLDDMELKRLEAMGKQIEGLFGCPQDIEGTITSDGTVYILQSRPISFDFKRFKLWSSANVSESFPGVSLPLTYTFALVFYRLLNHDFFRRCGISEADIRNVRISTENLLGYINGRIYHCISNFKKMTAIHPLFQLFDQNFDTYVAELDKHYHGGNTVNESSTPGQIITLFERFRLIIVAVKDFLTIDRQYHRFVSWWQRQLDRRKPFDFKHSNPLDLIFDYHELWRQVGNWWGLTLINYQFMILFQMLSQKLVGKANVDKPDALLSDLLCGDEQLKGVEIVLSALSIAETVRADEQLKEKFLNSDPEKLWRLVEMGTLGESLKSAVEKHLSLYGYRGLKELKLEQPNLVSTPWQFIALVKNYVGQSITSAELIKIENDVRARGEKHLKAALKNRKLLRIAILFCVKQLRKTLRRREQGRYMRSELFGYSKAVFDSLAAALVRENLIDQRSDVFYLTHDELLGAFEGTTVTRSLKKLIEIRKEDQAHYKTNKPVKEFVSTDRVENCVMFEKEESKSSSVDGVLNGIGSSGGRVQGIAKVVLEPDFNDRLCQDHILVAQETDPGWLFLMLSARGIIVERGSMLSHTAITGRKFGIPTVVALENALELIPDGALLEMDGGSGRVRILNSTKKVA